MGRNSRRPLAIITGANGGMGRCCARVLGATRDLVLTDASPALADFVRELEGEGCTVAGSVVGDVGGPEVLDTLARHAADREGFDVLIHTAGLGPSAPWRDIIEVNCIATVKLLERLSPCARDGSAAVLIASIAGHMLPPNPQLDALLAEPLSPRFCDDLEPLLAELAGVGGANAYGTLAYFVSKKKVIDLCVEHAAAWGAAGARIVSISPGMTYTPMGRHEAAADPLSGQMVTSTPIGRWGTPMEIALAAEFLVSPAAAFITGTDLKVDGGSMAAVQLASREAWLDSIQRNHQV
jgi:NAD(P)-dependent dehydrogenase (short-subunit alcohol dehydrogenase family)